MVISVQNYLNAGVQTVQVKDEDFFWVKMSEVQKKLGVKNISGLVTKEIIGFIDANKPNNEDFKKYKRFLQEITNKATNNSKDKYARNDLMEKIKKNCRGVKKCNDGKNRSEKEKQSKILEYF